MRLGFIREVEARNFANRIGLAARGHGTGGEIIATADDFISGDLHKVDCFGFARFETDCGAGGDIKPHTIGASTVKPQGRIGLNEMVMTANLDWAVAEIGYSERD